MDENENKQLGHFGFDVAEVTKLNLGPGDVLAVTVKNDEVSQASLALLQGQLKDIFPENDVFVFGMGTNDDLKFSIVSKTETGYCSDCTCGKKEQAEGDGNVSS